MDSPRLLHVASAACLLLAGCEYPTEPPLLDQRWVIPVQETTLVAEVGYVPLADQRYAELLGTVRAN